ncbi:hypothetical protein I5R65_19095 [Herbaspirillum sp. AP02]|uniref:hypothetical protein n=1 Tax=unclassified Herbaspirillum TaxID=2624150 RepID=UPI0015DB76D8|nr:MULTISPECIES: hypothetical protein [unclassified Herbaspirillum]MBG7621581.1 hypothetical protein [Herbaspirillum sp. AP02]NZD69669.1 hypothetical protein [Herbaspirillum sp. AP21]
MNTTVLKFSESDAFLKSISIKTIKDVRALDVDLLLTDQYRFTGSSSASEGGYDMGNIRLLYQTTTANENSTPTMAVSFTRARAQAGDVIALYEGTKLLVSKTLTSTDLTTGTGTLATLELKVSDSLSAGNHAIVSKYTTAAGASSLSAAETVSISAAMKAPLLTQLTVKASYDTDANAKAVVLGGERYAAITDPGTGSGGVYDKGLIFSGNITTPGLTGNQQYLVTISLGGKMLAFDTFTFDSTAASTNSFTLQAAPNLLAPGFYRDLTATVTNVTEGSIHNGQTSVIKDVGLGWYWAAQSMGDLSGGSGSDGLLLSATPSGSSPTVTTGDGADTLTVGAFGKTGNFSATVTDFKLGLDKVQVFGQTVTAANFASFATRAAATADGLGTTLVVDLDGAGAGSQTYTLNLQNLKYVAANTQTIFGV